MFSEKTLLGAKKQATKGLDGWLFFRTSSPLYPVTKPFFTLYG